MMPTRRRTREQDRARRIDAERALNAERVAERNKPPPYLGPCGTPNELGRNPPLRGRDDEETPLAGHTLQLVSASLLELES